jgi:predicted alpha/beta hydrolase family esterase
MKQVVLIHGGEDFVSYEAYISSLKAEQVAITDFLPKHRWRNALPERLGTDYQVFTPDMPNKRNAHYEEWKIWFEKMEPFLLDDVILAGHSLGGIFLAKYLSENIFPKRIKSTILISAPYDSDGLEPPLADFALTNPLTKFLEQAGDIYIIHAEDDPVVPFSHAHKYLEELSSARLVELKTGQHFSQPELPELVELIRSIS